jgi:hypothetical protein
MYLEGRNWGHLRARVAFLVSHHDSPGGDIDARGEGRSRTDTRKMAIPECRFDGCPVCAPEPGVVKRYPAPGGVSELLSRPSIVDQFNIVADCRCRIADPTLACEPLGRESVTELLGFASRPDERETLTAVRDAIPYQPDRRLGVRISTGCRVAP